MCLFGSVACVETQFGVFGQGVRAGGAELMAITKASRSGCAAVIEVVSAEEI